MVSSILLVSGTAISLLTAAHTDCLGADAWSNGLNCVTGHGNEVTEDILADLASCMKSSAKDDGTYTVEGNRVTPPYGSGKMVTWSLDNREVYIISNKKDDICVDLIAMGDILNDGFEDGCRTIIADNDDDWNVKMGAAKCDPVYGCGNTAYKSIGCM